jgi:type IX secretion system PorP/SprF family membrane protein
MNSKVRLNIFCLLFALISVTGLAQQDPQVTQYMFNSIYVTPGAAGVEGVTRLTALHRSQWQGYQSSFDNGGAPTTQVLTFSTPIFKLNSGFGAYVMRDKAGPLNTLEVQGMYAYHLGIKDSKLSIGVKVGMYSQTIDYDQYRAIHPGDPFLQDKSGKESQIRPDLGFGVMYRSEKYYAGMGINHITKAQFDFGLTEVRGALENHMNFTAGYFYDVNFDLQLNPSVLVKTDFNEYSFDLALIATLKNTMWGGLAFRQSEAANLLLGYSFLKDKSLKLGYAIDFVVKDRAAKENFSHELMLSYELPVGVGSGKKVVRTPRYRH